MTQIVQAHPRQAGCFDKPHKGARQGSRRPRLMVGLQANMRFVRLSDAEPQQLFCLFQSMPA